MQGLHRKPANYLLFPGEEGTEVGPRQDLSLNKIEDLRRRFQIVNEEQGGLEAVSYAVGSDAEFQVSEELKGLREGMAKLAKLAHAKDGLREFVRDIAFLFRRSCLFRPCSLILDKITRFAFTDECFPYTKGEYLDDTCDSPRAEKCIKASNHLIDPDGDDETPPPGGFPLPTKDPSWKCD
jgi:hypothetical protein